MAGSRFLRRNFRNTEYEGKLDTILREVDNIASKQEGITMNDMKHCLRVESNVGYLLSEKTKKKVYGKNAFLLSAASIVHDIDRIGRTRDSVLDHGREAERLFQEDEDVQRIFFGDDNALSRAISFMVGPHHDGNMETVPERFSWHEPPDIRLRDLASLLRLGDMIDTDERRVPYIVYRLASSSMDDRARDVMKIRRAIDGWELSPNKRKVMFQVNENTDEETLHLVREYIQELCSDVTQSQERCLRPFTNVYITRGGRLREEEVSFPVVFDLRTV